VEAPEQLLKVILLGAVEGEMEVWVNGRAAGKVIGLAQATSLDVTSWVRPGRNVIGVRGVNTEGAVRVAVLLEMNGDLARQRWATSGPGWISRTGAGEGWANVGATREGWGGVVSLGKTDAGGGVNPFDPKKMMDAYNSWKMAIGAGVATDPSGFQVPAGFRVELVRSAQPGEDSWVAMAFDGRGRVTLAREKRGLMRLGLEGSKVTRVEVVHETLMECRGLLYVGDALYCNANNTKALVRLRDADGDGRFEKAEELLKTEGGVGHGRNHVKLGPDGWLYVVHGNNVKLPGGLSVRSPLRGYEEDQVLKNPWDVAMFDGDVVVPAGHVLRMNPERPTEVELFAGGMRNPMDVAFNRDGELFTFDADMEWDVGAPWYMPNRVLHVVAGADYGFRRGTGRFRSHYADTLPSVVDIGLASPTAVFFGSGGRFPEKYRDALYVCDWAYGRILAVGLKATGASYRGSSEVFLSGRPLNVTDGCIGPDGALWFVTGGRGTQSGLYRVTYAEGDGAGGVVVTATSGAGAEVTSREARELRRRLEGFGVGNAEWTDSMVEQAWVAMGSEDRWIRYAARQAIERAPKARWVGRLVTDTHVARLMEAGLVLARTKGLGDEAGGGVVRRLLALRGRELSEESLRTLVRVWSVAWARDGARMEPHREQVLAQCEGIYPCSDSIANADLCRLLVVLRSRVILSRTLPLLERATSSEELMEYLFLLRFQKEGWSLESRRVWFDAMARASKMAGAQNYFRALSAVRAEMESSVPPGERAPLIAMVTKSNVARAAAGVEGGAKLNAWRLETLLPEMSKVKSGRSHARGQQALIKGQCVTCHRVSADGGGAGGVSGPDLTQVGARFGSRDLLEQILNPSKVIDEKYRQVLLTLKDGSEVGGILEREDDAEVVVRPSLLGEGVERVKKAEIRERGVSGVSPMPEGLLDVLTLEEVLDLVAFLEAGGKAEDGRFVRGVEDGVGKR